ncbi:MAG: hypothetical protein M1825_001203 [Sarcosagium campestre]|nr:MAG: hypothetical protein M1825_001203 [Sarcosagium campestre]
MRNLSRVRATTGLSLSIQSLPLNSRPAFLCAICRARRVRQQISLGATFSTSSPALKTSFTEKLRRKIWGTDQPPGAADPYGGESALERSRRGSPVSEDADPPLRPPPAQTVSNVDSDLVYQPATSGDGLEEVGGVIEPEVEFEGFAPSNRLTTPQGLTIALHCAVVEILALQVENRPFSDLVYQRGGEDGGEGLTAGVRVTSNPHGQGVSLEFPDTSTRIELLNSLLTKTEHIEDPSLESQPVEDAEIDLLANELPSELPSEPHQIDTTASSSTDTPASLTSTTLSRQQLEELDRKIASWDPAWLTVSLDSLDLKFAILKRVTHLTAVRIPDPVLAQLHTVGDLLDTLVAPPRPKKLADELMANPALTSLPNVTLHSRRITPVDRHIQVGRWKLIEKELRNDFKWTDIKDRATKIGARCRITKGKQSDTGGYHYHALLVASTKPQVRTRNEKYFDVQKTHPKIEPLPHAPLEAWADIARDDSEMMHDDIPGGDERMATLNEAWSKVFHRDASHSVAMPQADHIGRRTITPIKYVLDSAGLTVAIIVGNMLLLVFVLLYRSKVW